MKHADQQENRVVGGRIPAGRLAEPLRSAKRGASRGVRGVLLDAAVLALLFLFPAASLAEPAPTPDPCGGSNIHLVLPESPEQTVAASGHTAQAALVIENWQGAKNYHESFDIRLSGGTTGGAIRFASSNCSVSPATGTTADTYHVTVTGAGTYSLTAIMAGDATFSDASASRTGQAGKTDQAPLVVSGWGDAKDYYHTFSITLSGGSVGGKVRFAADGCSVNPSTGSVNNVYTVTVTRVGSYELTAIMEGNRNYNDVCSTRQCGTSGKTNQQSVVIDGWEETARYGTAFEIDISGGSSGEPMNITASGCELTKVDGSTYEVVVTSVGPYSVTAVRPGNYGYSDTSTSVCGVSRQAYQPTLSVTGWSGTKNVSDSFPIHVRGGASDAIIRFSTVGCAVSPETGTADTSFLVTVNSVGSYSLTAFVDATAHYSGVSSMKFSGIAGKAPQREIEVQGWDNQAYSGSSFDIRLGGGSGSGATSVTTLSGCTAVLKSDAEGLYTVTVSASGGSKYALRVDKLGDANYCDAPAATVSGTAGMARQAALAVSGWSDMASTGDTFTINLSGGSGDGAFSFEADGCTVAPGSGDSKDYAVTITAESGTYSLTVNRAGTGGYARATMLKSGNVRPSSLRTDASDEMVLLDSGYEVWFWAGIILTLLTVLTGILLFRENRRKTRRRHR